MSKTLTTASPRIHAAILRDGRIASLHTSLRTARLSAGSDDLVLSVEPNAFGRRPVLSIGDRAQDFAGQVTPA